jgi:hypothetical protein
MTSDVCFSIVSKDGLLAATAQQPGHGLAEMSLPANAMGLEIIKLILNDYDEPVRVAVTGSDAVGLGLALQYGPRREVFIVSSAMADKPGALARFARRMP